MVDVSECRHGLMPEMCAIFREPEALKRAMGCIKCAAAGRWTCLCTRPAEDRKAGEEWSGGDWAKVWNTAQSQIIGLTAERDALRAQLDIAASEHVAAMTDFARLLTSDEAVDAVVLKWREYIKDQPQFRLKLWARDALAAALRVAKGEG